MAAPKQNNTGVIHYISKIFGVANNTVPAPVPAQPAKATFITDGIVEAIDDFFTFNSVQSPPNLKNNKKQMNTPIVNTTNKNQMKNKVILSTQNVALPISQNKIATVNSAKNRTVPIKPAVILPPSSNNKLITSSQKNRSIIKNTKTVAVVESAQKIASTIKPAVILPPGSNHKLVRRKFVITNKNNSILKYNKTRRDKIRKIRKFMKEAGLKKDNI